MASAASVTKDVQPFNSIRVCQPFNVLVSPSSQADQYQIVLDADDSVGRALQVSVSGGVLSLGVSGRFSTSNPIRLTVKCGSPRNFAPEDLQDWQLPIDMHACNCLKSSSS